MNFKLPVDYTKISAPKRKMVREQYEIEQKGACSYCKAQLTDSPPKGVSQLPINKKLFPPGFFRWPVHLHHDHKTGMTLGAVHNYCNAVLWQYYGE